MSDEESEPPYAPHQYQSVPIYVYRLDGIVYYCSFIQGRSDSTHGLFTVALPRLCNALRSGGGKKALKEAPNERLGIYVMVMMMMMMMTVPQTMLLPVSASSGGSETTLEMEGGSARV